MVVKMEEGMDRIQAAAYAWSHTAAPMLAGTLVTVIGFLPVGFARSTAGEYAGNIFWIVGFSLIASWIVAVVFTPYLGVKLLPEIKTVKGWHAGIYSTARYQRLRQLVSWCVRKKYTVAGIVVGALLMAGGGMAVVKKQFFPNSDRPELLVEVQLPSGTSIETTSAAAKRIERWLSQQPEYAHGECGLGRTRPQVALRFGSRAIAAHRAFTRRGRAAVAVSPKRSNHHPGS